MHRQPLYPDRDDFKAEMESRNDGPPEWTPIGDAAQAVMDKIKEPSE